MTKPFKPKKRLSRNCWQEAALELLHNKGINAVIVDALARQKKPEFRYPGWWLDQ
jgi:hypothetical protein